MSKSAMSRTLCEDLHISSGNVGTRSAQRRVVYELQTSQELTGTGKTLWSNEVQLTHRSLVSLRRRTGLPFGTRWARVH